MIVLTVAARSSNSRISAFPVPVVNYDSKVVEIVAKKIVKQAKKGKRSSLDLPGNFCISTEVNTSVTTELIGFLKLYNGPKVLITSLRRNWKGKSAHNRGRAVDFDLNEQLVNYLVSSEGQLWLNSQNCTMYIEGVPGCREVKKYESREECRKYIFYNRKATGSHIHIELGNVKGGNEIAHLHQLPTS